MKTKKIELVKRSRKMDLDIKDNTADWDLQFEGIKAIIAEPFVKKYTDFFDIQTMAARLHNKESMSSEFKLKEGSWFLSMIVPQSYDKNGNVTSVLIANRDVTDEKMRELRQEEELREAKLKAECANKAKSSFLFNMSHDIRTPMNAILGYAQLMEDELKEKDLPEISEYLKKLQQSGNLLLSIINNVLDMARIESGRMEIDENYGMIEDIWQTLFEIFDDEAKKKNIALHYTINVEHEHILTDVTKVKEIFVNILSNTMKYTPSGGSVMINIDELPCSGPGYMIVRTRVSDTGIGMSKDFQEHMFKQLSSGMKSRLAFSIASLVNPDILILDEVLSVGDGSFRQKSGNKMREILANGVTGILVSHSIDQVRELCNKVLWLDHGKQMDFGETQEVCDRYEAFMQRKK